MAMYTVVFAFRSSAAVRPMTWCTWMQGRAMWTLPAINSALLTAVVQCHIGCHRCMQVVRCFEDDDVIHVDGKVDPVSDADTINFELALADVAQIEKRLERLKKTKGRNKDEQAAGEVRRQQ